MRKKLIVVMLLSFGLVSGTLFTSCDQGKKKNEVENLNQPFSRQCPSKPSSGLAILKNQTSTVYVSPFADRKVVVDENEPQRALAGVQVSKSLQKFFVDQKLVATLDAQCARSTWSGEITKNALEFNPSIELPHSGQVALMFKLERDMNSEELEEWAARDFCVIGVGPERFYKTSQVATTFTSDTYVDRQGHLDFIKLVPSYNEFLLPNLSTAGLDVIVAIIDTGVDIDHPDLAANIYSFPNGQKLYDSVKGNYTIGASADVDRVQGHGTHVAGLVAAASGNSVGMVGAIPARAKIMAVRPFSYFCTSDLIPCEFNSIKGSDPKTGETLYDCKLNGTTYPCEFGARNSDVINAINFAVDNGAKILNLSLGSFTCGNGGDSSYLNALQNAASRGVFSTIAAGNDGASYGGTLCLAKNSDGSCKDSCTGYQALPGRYGRDIMGAMNVGSVNYSNGVLSRFSNYNPTYVEIGAPGAESSPSNQRSKGLYSTMSRLINPGADAGCSEVLNSGYGCRAGTSQAAPLVAAVGAHAVMMYRAKYGVEPTAATIEDLVKLAATKSQDSNLKNAFQDGNILSLERLKNTVDNYCL